MLGSPNQTHEIRTRSQQTGDVLGTEQTTAGAGTGTEQVGAGSRKEVECIPDSDDDLFSATPDEPSRLVNIFWMISR